VLVPEQAKKPSGGGNLKYILGGLLLLGSAAGLWLLLQQPPAAAVIVAPPPVGPARVNPMAQPELILEEEKDAGKPAAAAAAPSKHGHRVVRDDWDCEGDLAREALQKVIDSNRSQIRNCYERRLKVNNILQGDLKLKLKVGATGQMAAAAVSGTLKDPEVFKCVRAIAEHWTFPPPSGGNCAVVQVPFQFSPKSN